VFNLKKNKDSMSQWLWVVVTISLLVAITVSIYVTDVVRQRQRQKQKQNQENALVQRMKKTRVAAGVSDVPGVSRSELSSFIPVPFIPVAFIPVAPLRWDSEEGAYMIQLKLGAGVVELVLDTGSSQISAKGQGCTWTSCDEDDGLGSGACTTKPCPCTHDDCSRYGYAPTGVLLKPGEHDAGIKTKLVYGSQEDTVSHYLDEVSLPCSPTSPLQTSPVRSRADVNMTNEYLLGSMVVHFVHHIKGASSSNLLGLARPPLPGKKNEYENGKFVVVEKLFHEKGIAVWSLLLEKDSGLFALGSLQFQFPPLTYIPMVDPPSFSNFVTHFYIVNILSLETGPDLKHMTRIKKNSPEYCVIDTGTTYTYGCTALGDQLRKLQYNETSWYLRLTLGTKKKSVTLTYSPHDLVDPEFTSSSVFQCEAGKTLPDFDDIFPSRNVLLFGAMMMQNMYWEFDLTHQQIAVWPIRS